MFPLPPDRLRALLTALAPELEACANPSGPVDRGRALFGQLACAACHTGLGQAPRLRLGFPLLGRAYFAARLRHGAGNPTLWQRRWQALKGNLIASHTGAVQMPAYATPTDADLDALYAYISTDASDVPAPPALTPPSRIAVPDNIRLALYREVQARVFDTSCRHCHSPDAADQGIIQSVFGKPSAGIPSQLPMTRLAVSPDPTLRKLLSPGPDCSDSQLLLRLKSRAAEWSGRTLPGAPRGMPLTLPPLATDVIRLLEVWTAAGCPSDRGDLCDPC